MITDKNIEKRLWMLVVMLITYLSFGSFLISKSFYDLIYVIILYSFLIFIRFHEKKK